MCNLTHNSTETLNTATLWPFELNLGLEAGNNSLSSICRRFRIYAPRSEEPCCNYCNFFALWYSVARRPRFKILVPCLENKKTDTCTKFDETTVIRSQVIVWTYRQTNARRWPAKTFGVGPAASIVPTLDVSWAKTRHTCLVSSLQNCENFYHQLNMCGYCSWKCISNWVVS